MEPDLSFSIILFITMFIISGYNKVSTLGVSESKRFSLKTGLDLDISQWIVFLAGLIELLSCFAIIYGIFNNNIKITKYGIYSLILFTILATLIFYAFPLKYKPFLSNLSIITGLYLVMNICFFKNK